MTDRLEETLRTLALDVDRVGLADSASVRDRGDRRTRHQVVGSALATVALVVAAVGVTGTLTADREAVQGPPANPTVTTTQEPVLSLADRPLLEPADLGTVGVYQAWQANPDPAAADQRLSRCLPAPGSFPAAESASRLYYTDLDATVTEHVLRFGDGDGSAVAMDQMVRAVEGCDPGDPADKVSDRSPVAVPVAGSDALRASRSAAPPGSELSYYELGIVRRENILVLLQWSSMGLPDGVDWVWTEQRLQTAIDRAVG